METKQHRQRPPLYWTWAGMKARCENPNHKAYLNYGGRGITVCKRWQTFENFAKDMGPKPTPEHTLERINNDRGYSPANCKWATIEEQVANKRLTTVDRCRRGHRMSEENTYIRPDGYRACRDCMLDADKRYRENKKRVGVNS
jgi:hypothetical protein